MKRPWILMLFVLLSILPVLSLLEVDAVEEGSDVVNIETYIEFRIEFDSGDTLHLDAEASSEQYPISVFLLRGQNSFDDWIESETVDIGSIKNGSSSMNRTSSFQVIDNFSFQNTTSFENSIDIGEHDTYFLIIALHRDSKMDTDDILSRATQVEYKVDWSIETKSLNVPLLIVAIVLFIIGIVFIAFYYISYSRAKMALEEEAEVEKDRKPRPRGPPMRIDRGRGGRSPPLR
ncbi:MAG: hypothetical protein U9R75_02885 [Candidatus Thermoplasmatota archaeon]|nr:hypothetical protein [Candidatus Thermoplasmatota archaeon]